MCKPKPGPRCSSHASEALGRAMAAVRVATKALNAPPVDATEQDQAALLAQYQAAVADAVEADRLYDTTPAGQDALRTDIEAATRAGEHGRVSDLQARLDAAVATRAKQVHDLASVDAAQSAMGALYGLDDDQAASVWRGAWKRAQPNKNPPSLAKWQAHVDAQIERLALSEHVSQDQFEALHRALRRARAAAPDPHTFAAMKDLSERADKAVRAVRRQQEVVVALRGASSEEVAERYRAYRAQYQTDFAHLPAAQRPDPPEEWVRGYGSKDMMAVSSPQDRATLYAMYRMQADPDAFETNPEQRFASIDLETAGPEGKDGFTPANGAIIEVGIVEHDAYGVEVSRYSQLIHPGEEVLARCGTGAVQVHGITPADVAGKPSWATVAPQIAARLDGRVMLAQNARFERDWLAHHMGAQSQPFEYYGPTVDTLTIARQHWADLPNHRLSTICGRVGVAYTDGHRAEHDADVTARSFFAMRDKIHADYLANPVRANVPQPPRGAGRRTSPVTRLRSGEFNPADAAGEWATPPTAA